MSFIYWLAKFSREAMLVELLLMGLISFSYFGYLLIQKRRYGAARRQIPDNVVREYLAQMISHAEGFKTQLFGSEFKITPSAGGPTISMANLASDGAASGASAAELTALKAALATATAKQDELNKVVAGLTSEKAALEAKAKDGGAAGGPPKDLLDKLAKLEAKLAEYEVIEDDLANLKKYQQENKQLRSQLDALSNGASGAAPTPAAEAAPAAPAPASAAEPVAAEPAPTEEPAPAAAAEMATSDAAPIEAAVETPAAAAPESPVASAEEAASNSAAAASFDGLVDKVEQSLTPEPAAAASATDPKALEQVQTTAPVVEATPEIQAVEAAPADDAAPKGEKSDADLLNEFERMLSS